MIFLPRATGPVRILILELMKKQFLIQLSELSRFFQGEFCYIKTLNSNYKKLSPLRCILTSPEIYRDLWKVGNVIPLKKLWGS